MDQHAAKAGWDIYLFGIPLIAFLIFGFFRLDQVFTARKKATPNPVPSIPTHPRHEKSMRCDPDGTPWDE